MFELSLTPVAGDITEEEILQAEYCSKELLKQEPENPRIQAMHHILVSIADEYRRIVGVNLVLED